MKVYLFTGYAILLLLHGLSRSHGRQSKKEKIREDRIEDIPAELVPNYFKVGDEILLLPEVESNLNFERMVFADPKDLKQQKELRDSRFWGRLYMHGWPLPIQYMQAHFGKPAPTGVHQVIMAPDTHLCPGSEALQNLDFGNSSILVALRGECTFGDKARAGLSVNAAAVVVVNTDGGLDHLSAPDAHDIGMSVVSIARDEGKVLLKYLSKSERGLTGSLVPINCAKREEANARSCEPCTVEDENFVDSVMRGGYVSLSSTSDDKYEFLLAKFGSGLKENQPFDVVVVSAEESCSNSSSALTTGNLEGKFVVTKRGACMFVEKAQIADELGAAGLIIVNHETSAMAFGCEPRWAGANISIPVISTTDLFGEVFFNPIDDSNGPPSVNFVLSSEVSVQMWESLNELRLQENWPKAFGAAKTLYEKRRQEIGESLEMGKWLDDVWNDYHSIQKKDREGIKKDEL